MKAALFEYIRPATLDEGLQHLADTPGAKALGGSQSLGPMLNLRLARPRAVVDIAALPQMREVTVSGSGRDATIRIGGAVTHAEIEDGLHAPLRGTLLQSVAGGIAYRAIRNRGTVAGSLAHADPAADWVLAMTALAARLELRSAGGARMLPMEGFMQGAYTTALAPGEIIAAIHVPQLDASARWGYAKFCRKTGEFAEASCCAVFDPPRGFARVVIGALDGAPRPLPAIAALVAGSGALPSRARIDEAVAASAPTKDSIDRQRITTAVLRCLEQVLGPVLEQTSGPLPEPEKKP
ncbi:Carbon monoxide dehydrogenase medium chain [Delftia tsuruhatensis]|uniref:FAD binding domain-containing protein n=1 Tax=Delftia tsuruhatensis TaxID=180282 RepID=UPI001E7B8957|nr:FAD binding domain-containing protein [Delftia tsuruhatensis]CAB5713209.1 Carbon monoxide dehydrogenase medium chain [Delftia tsuruhatensis]CAC9691954.1 Carbon monoxide dehydrogenase medium chain [Delftia tsuruhatensis]